jgi:hypothetical protein
MNPSMRVRGDGGGGDPLRTLWRRLCDRIAATGDRFGGFGFPTEPRDQAEAVRHLTRLTSFAVQWFLEFGDPEFPAFLRFDDDVTRWGGPNVDNHYLRAKIDSRFTYYLRANVTGVRALIISTPEGDLQMGKRRVFAERSLDELHVAPDGSLTVVLSPDRHDGNWIPLDPAVDHVLIRQYVSDWERDRVATFCIDKVGNEGRAPGPLTPERVACALTDAMAWIEASLAFWPRYLAERAAQTPANVLGAPHTVPGGATDILYGAGFWKLGADTALVIELAPPVARYWSFQLYSLPWFESLDAANHITSLNGHSVHIDEDGRARLVVAHGDPGVPNWLDTEGRPEGMISYRYVWSETTPTPMVTLVRLRDVRPLLPASHPMVGDDARRAQIQRRRDAITRRYRT